MSGKASRSPGSPRPRLASANGRTRLQWCTGAPGIVAGAWEYLDEELLLAAAELIWRAGAHGDEKGHGICHGTAGNGFALLKVFARTGDDRWLERARRFAVHALKFFAGNNARCFQAEIDHDFSWRGLANGPLDDVALLDLRFIRGLA